MKKVALIFSTKITDPTGASAVMRSFHNNKELFKNNGIDLSVYSADSYSASAEVTVRKTSEKGFYKKSAQLLRRYASSHILGAFLHIYGSRFRASKKIIKDYISIINDDEVVFFHELFTCYEYLKRRKKHNAKIILVLHTDGDTFSMFRQYYKTLEKSFFYKYLLGIERNVLANADRIGFVADYPRQNFLNNHPEIDKNKVFYVYNGLQLNSQKTEATIKPANTYEICCVGTISERKGQRFIVEALHKLSQDSDIPNVHFSIVGGGTIKDELEALTKLYDISKYITFYGSSSNVEEFLLNSDIFILPSTNEGFPIAILEAMRVGLPIVSTKVAGIPEMINEGNTGTFIEPSVDGVLDFLNKVEKYDWNEMGKKSYNLFIEKFTVEKMIESYSNIFKSL